MAREQPTRGVDTTAAAASGEDGTGLDETIAQLVIAPLEEPAAAVMANLTDRPGQGRARGRAI